MADRVTRKPPWLRVKVPGGEGHARILGRRRRRGLATVCEEARCPNRAECWECGTATFMVMGTVCTRGCRFCAVETAARGQPLDPGEPAALAETVAELGLDYAVITTVTRDDLDDGGAAHIAACVRAVRARGVQVEVLIPDLDGDEADLCTVVVAAPVVLGHNLEVVRRLSGEVRHPRADHDRSLGVLGTLRRLAGAGQLVKSALLVGLGESDDEVFVALAELREAGCQMVAVGQYLQPTARHLPVVAYREPTWFDELAERARAMGFEHVAAGPLVRSSYRASELFVEGRLAGAGAGEG
jgi:lipoyl synthase